ncbi:MAG: hypothetical protein Q8Q81_16380 [Oxalobacteraceae bacterium]|nr:hypothetical protein [Oxalobacteraceae bacterium]
MSSILIRSTTLIDPVFPEIHTPRQALSSSRETEAMGGWHQ